MYPLKSVTEYVPCEHKDLKVAVAQQDAGCQYAGWTSENVAPLL